MLLLPDSESLHIGGERHGLGVILSLRKSPVLIEPGSFGLLAAQLCCGNVGDASDKQLRDYVTYYRVRENSAY